ncbi:adenylate kinase 8-like [Mauremys mutica]|uniref:adenylate kinase 8-like n=1 Tax=Mauremys mutica TaxID=74926 RepID=UPI001D15595F|nr:adenylate kinase 8-like [Mauremys mutica]
MAWGTVLPLLLPSSPPWHRHPLSSSPRCPQPRVGAAFPLQWALLSQPSASRPGLWGPQEPPAAGRQPVPGYPWAIRDCCSLQGATFHPPLPCSVMSQAAAGQPWNPGPGLESRRGVTQSSRGEMDVAAKPHIPPAMALYAEKHGVFQLMQSMVEALLIHQPEDPISFMIDHLKQDSDHVPRVFVLGPPAAGKTTIAMWLCKHLNASYLSQQKLLSNKTLVLAKEAQSYQQRQEQIPDELWVGLLQDRLLDVDCVREGWVLDGFPQTREQALLLQTSGIVPRHVVALYAPDTVLVERNLGKRLDPVSAEVYHTTFDWPTDPTVEQRLVQPDGCSEQATAKRLLEYHRNIQGIFQSYRGNLRTVNADQPCADVFSQVLTFVESQPRSAAPFTPRVLLCGPPGSGKSLQAALLAQKYGLVNVGCGQLLKEAVAEKSKIGELIKPYFESGCPVADNLVLKVLRERLGKLDCAAFGWVLHGFPRDADQAELLRNTGFIPNRVFFLTLPVEAILERVSQRATDPVTGERYHHLYKPAPSLELRRRLRQNPQDAAEKLELRVDLYGRHVADLEEFYEDAVYINADQDPYTVFESIESCLTRPLPRHTV